MTHPFRRLATRVSILLVGIILVAAVNLTAARIGHAQTGVLYAAPAAQGGGDCSSWANACTLQTALANAVSSNEIWVKEGLYLPGTTREATFALKSGVALYGGFAGTETSREQRYWQTNLTILSGDIDGNDINTDGNDIAESPTDNQGANAYHVVTGNGTIGNTVLDGFIITAGQANGTGPEIYGGGMVNYSNSPTLTHIIFSGNTATNRGGGMYNDSSSPTLTNVTFTGNLANNGGGMVNKDSSPKLTNVTFTGNEALFSGGGMFNKLFSRPVLANVIMWGDSAPIWSEIANSDSNPRISYSDIQGCGGSGGGWNSICGRDDGGNIDADPLYAFPAEGNLRLQLTSPAIDAGDNTAVPSGITSDLEGNPRFVDIPSNPDTGRGTPPIVDMGAYEAHKYLYAAPTAQGSGDCSTWANACTLQTALGTGASGQEIWVMEGLHIPGTTREATFALKSGVALYGGFAGTETSLDQRYWQSNPTILSGDVDGNDSNTDGNNIAETPAEIIGDNAYHVLTSIGMDSTDVLDGFIITAGQANGINPENHGGGMFNKDSSPTLTNLIFRGNFASKGGGMDNDSGSPTLTNVTFSGNTGGGMANYSGSPTLTNVTFSGNSSHSGGGMDNYSGNPTLTDVTFSGNTASSGGGGLYNGSGSPTLTKVTFSGNSSHSGGGMDNDSGSPTLTNVIFSDNTATNRGGGMYNFFGSPTLTDVTFSGNTGTKRAGGLYNERGSLTLKDVSFSNNTAEEGGGMFNYVQNYPKLTDVSFSGNTASGDGGGMHNDGGSPTLTNVTFSGNSAQNGGGMFNDNSGNPTLTNVTFSGNTANGDGGGMFNDNSSISTLTNVTFSGNTANGDGGGMYNHNNGNPTLTNVTFSGNSAQNGGGGMFNLISNPTLINVILWGDSASNQPEIFNMVSTPIISYSDIQGCGGTAGWNSACGSDYGGNIDANPLFMDAPNGNLRLQRTSPAIDAGQNAAVPFGVVTDLDDNPRFVEIPNIPDTGSGTPPLVDMGAYEAQSTLPHSDAGPDQTVHTGVMVTLDGSGSSDLDGDLPLIYLWKQISGTTVTLNDPTVVNPTFTAPNHPDILAFSLAVRDSMGMPDPTPDEVVITVENPTYCLFLPLIIK